jgi:hypothetical protein
VLSAGELAAVDRYLSTKHGTGRKIALPRRLGRGKPLVTLTNPPAMQLFVPGFSAWQLPVELTNINNVRYRSDGKLVALGYDGNVWLLSDNDGDGLEEKAEQFWKNDGRLRGPIGMALTPPGYIHDGKTSIGLFIQKGRHYGFPPRHPRHLPSVMDEPSLFDYSPQLSRWTGLTRS